MISPNYILPGNIICPDITQNTIDQPCCPAVFIAPMTVGTATEYTLQTVVNSSLAKGQFGVNSPAARMAEVYFDQNPFGMLKIVPYVPTGAASASTVAFTGAATENGTIFFYVNTQFVTVDVITGDTAADIAADLASAISGLPVTGVQAGNNVNLTAIFGGIEGNQIQVAIDGVPAGLTGTVAAMSGGAGVPDYARALEVMGECCCYDFTGFLHHDDASMDLMALDFRTNRWGCECWTGGRYYNTFRGSFSDMTTHLFSRQGQDPFGGTMMVCESEDQADYEKLAAMIGQAHASTCANPSKSWYKRELLGIPNVDTDSCGDACLDRTERNLLAYYGMMTTVNGPNGYQIIESDVGRGAINAQGDVDLFLRYPQAAYQTMEFGRLFAEWSEQFDGLLMSANEINPRRGQEVLTPNMFLAEFKSFLREHEGTLVENIDAAIELVKFDIDPNNPSRANVTAFFDPISAFRTFAITLAPRIQLEEIV